MTKTKNTDHEFRSGGKVCYLWLSCFLRETGSAGGFLYLFGRESPVISGTGFTWARCASVTQPWQASQAEEIHPYIATATMYQKY